ncbi:MAG: PhzF family phenazine biosynthesis protein [Melioribacter sp.]|uniref:PhzF family phenazine biosynthesis protein n=1 Tax=Rosettibacter primus TaxID=3111523 RepID=UPI00247D7217|nr:PhzF family phenazine biosynthesis protein [Melioribacter sp.]
MILPIYQVDAFTGKIFSGNPAAVIPLEEWLDDKVLQSIAMENNLSETAFFVKKGDKYHIRWMTPQSEVPLCGHATLASSFVLFNFIEKDKDKIIFTSKSGDLIVERNGDLLTLDFPANKPHTANQPYELNECFQKIPIEVLENGLFLFIVFDDEDFIKNYLPDFNLIRKLHKHGVIITAKSKTVDFVSRVFVPNEGVDEDPVTGSAHTVLTPYWSEKLNKKKLIAHQVSKRGGELFCENMGERVKISGKAVLYMTGNIYL